MIKTDLHIHSRFSNDGEFSVSGIIQKCKEHQVQRLSITDHNSAKANEEAAKLAGCEGFKYIPGIEIDCIFNDINLHILGYGIDWKSTDFDNLEKNVTAKVMNSFDKMIENILALGFVVDKNAVLQEASGQLPSPELIAEVMLSEPGYYSPMLIPYMEGGNRSDMPYINFYLDYFAQGKPAFVPVEYISFDEAITLIMDNGGTPVVAHPGLNLQGCENIAEQLLAKGARGLEVFNNYHTHKQISYFAELVEKNNLLMTCGSDFHGKTKPLINIGDYKFSTKYVGYLEQSIRKLC